MTAETAERRFAFKFEQAIQSPKHIDCNCFPCRVFSQWQDWIGTRDWSTAVAIVNMDQGNLETRPYTQEEIETAKISAKAVHDPEIETTQQAMKISGSQGYAIWNGCVFWVV